MRKRYVIILLILTILLGLLMLAYVLNYVGLVNFSEVLPFLQAKNPVVVEDSAFPTEMEKQRFQKWEERLSQQEENINARQGEIDAQLKDIEQQLSEIERTKEGLLLEKKRLAMLSADKTNRSEKISDMAVKVTNMPPDKAVEMMKNWPDFDIIDVLREIDTQANREGTQSLSPYLLTLFVPERRAEITRKMLLPPLDNQASEEELEPTTEEQGQEQETANQ